MFAFPASLAAVVVWVLVMAITPSRSVARYGMYWLTILYVPAALAVLPYFCLVRAMSRGRAAAATIAWVALVVVGSFVLLLLAIENANFTF